LEAENESLKKFLKESFEEETKKRKELSDKHIQEASNLAENLKKIHNRVKTLAGKSKAQEAEVEAIDKLIFCKGFSMRFPASSYYTLTAEETD
jgi:predicted nuclease with TOPRIM domain